MKIASLVLGAAMIVAAAPVFAANVDVQMLNKGDKGAMVFQPDLVKVAPGDTVTFLSVDKGHNVNGPAGWIPDGAEPFKSKLSETYTQTFSVPGVYLVKCDPHYGMGMVALIVVGEDTSNLDQLKAIKHPKKPQDVVNGLFDQLAP